MLSGVQHLLKFGDGPSDAIMVDNAEWLDKLEYIPFLREVGKHFSVNRMLTMDSVKLRLDREQPMSFLEFNYSIMQAYDFVELYKRYGCRLQSSGSDQWGNVVSGIDLGRRMENVQLFGLTTPLITTSSGAKMGKTAAGAVWLNKDMLSVYDYWQFWRNTEDGDVGRFLRIFTDLPLNEIARLESLQGAELNDAKKMLATEATAILHGRDAATDAAETARRTFEEGESGRRSADLLAEAARWRAESRSSDRACSVELRSTKADREQRSAAQRYRVSDPRLQIDAERSDVRRCAEAVQRQEEARAGEAGLGFWRRCGRRRARRGCVGRRLRGIRHLAFENPTENSRRQHGQRIDADIRLVGVAVDRIGHAEHALTLLRDQHLANDRDRAQHAVQPEQRHQRSLERDRILRPVDVAVSRKADRRAGRPRDRFYGGRVHRSAEERDRAQGHAGSAVRLQQRARLHPVPRQSADLQAG